MSCQPCLARQAQEQLRACLHVCTLYLHMSCTCPAQALGADFAPYLQYCLPLALQSIALDDGTAGGSDGEGEEGAKEQGAAGALGGISDDEEEDDDGKGFSVHTGVGKCGWFEGRLGKKLAGVRVHW